MTKWWSARSRRSIVLIGFLVFAFALYVAAESGSDVAQVALLAGLTGLMLLATYTG